MMGLSNSEVNSKCISLKAGCINCVSKHLVTSWHLIIYFSIASIKISLKNSIKPVIEVKIE